MNLIKDYESSGSEIDVKEKLIKKIKTEPITVKLNPEVDITLLQQMKRSERNHDIRILYPDSSQKNHLTGKVEAHYMNTFNFEEQFHNYKNFGFAQDPSDETSNKIIYNRQLQSQQGLISELGQNQYFNKSVFNTNDKGDQTIKKEASKKRKKGGSAASGDFLGPWAGYQDEEKYMAQELSEEQKEILNRIEEKRIKKVEEKKEDKVEKKE